VFKVPSAGLYEFILNCTMASASTYINLHLCKNDKVAFTTAYAKPSYFYGGVMVAKMCMTPTDTAFFSVLVGGSNSNTANILLNYDIAHWGSIRMVEY